jgi:hypothetical protein
MAAYISIQKALGRILISLFFACLAGILVWFGLRGSGAHGPLLGPHYDLLLKSVKQTSSAEILLIENRDAAGDIIEPALAASALMTLAEMNASALVIQTPILGTASPLGSQAPMGSLWEDDLLVRFNDEFTLVNRNIRNLFDAIRTGSVAPAETEHFVGELLNLTERGKERLLAALIGDDAGGMRPLEQAAAVFGVVWVPGDLRLSARGSLESISGRRYSLPRQDWDGRARRVAPVLNPGEDSVEHVIYSALKSRIRRASAEYEYGGGLQTETEFPLPLDSGGNVLFIPPGIGQDFRRLSLEDFQKYEEADRELYRTLKEAEELGLYRDMDSESYPPFRYEYAQDIRAELLENPAPENRARWIGERARYFRSLDEFFAGPGRANLIIGYDELIVQEGLEEEGLQQVIGMRDEVIRVFQELWEQYTALLASRSALESSLAGAFCILGAPAAEDPEGGVSELGSLETSALLANSFLTGRVVRPGTNRDNFLALILSAFVIISVLAGAGPWVTLGAGLALSFAVMGGFSYAFVRGAFWIDPLIPGAAALAGILASFVFALIAKNRAAYRFRKAYGPSIIPVYLNRLIKAYHPLPSETLSVRAAIVAVRDGELKGIETRSIPEESAAAALAFRGEVLNIFGMEGGVVVGIEGDLVMIALGSPLERTVIRNTKTLVPYDDGPKPSPRSPAAKAMSIVRDIAGHIPRAAAWRFALDTGDCAFSYSEASGYTAYGRPVVCARLFSSLAARYKARVLVTGRVMEQNPELLTHKLGDLVDDGDKEGFYEARFDDVT